ncbi:hypothetical protein ACGF5H_29680 [Micromonospora chalcea]|uniref:hypothetical protein n=1 Tax=Micromonospora chalcea TaxID=1874 RepID=UPI0033266BE0
MILLCPNDHATIDNIPSGPLEYPVDALHDLKRKHEVWVAESTEFDRKAQVAAEQWAEIIDQLSTKLAWDDWLTHSGWLQSADGPQLSCEIYEQFKAVPPWILSRVWPQGHPRLRAVISQMALVLNDFLNVFSRYAKRMYDDSPTMETVRFYQSGEWIDNYHELVRRYEYHVDLVQDLTLELTRYGNWIADLVRDEFDPSFRVDQGALLVMRGPNQYLQFETFRTEFSEEERSSGRPYRSLEDFKRVRFTRDYVIGLQSSAE